MSKVKTISELVNIKKKRVYVFLQTKRRKQGLSLMSMLKVIHLKMVQVFLRRKQTTFMR